MLRKMRPVLIVLGLAVVIGSIIGARELTGGSGAPPAKPGDTAPRAAAGLVVIGNVDSDPSPVPYGLTAVLQSGTVTKVHVKEGDDVKLDQPLYEFDPTIQKRDVEHADAAVEYAKSKQREAEAGRTQHTEGLKVADTMVKAAEQKVKVTTEGYRLANARLETYYKAEKIPESEWAERKKNDPTLFAANAEYIAAENELTIARAKYNQLKTVDPEVQVKEAEAAVKQAEAVRAKAQAAVDLCVVRARAAGRVEHLTISPGTTLGISTRTPALWLIPTGKLVVRAEVEPEFAHRVKPKTHEGRQVVISDHTDAKLTYAGVVRRVPDTFMLKRNTADSFLGTDTRVIEVTVDVTEDPNAQDKPPLRVGQRVRVNLGQ